MYLSNLSFMFLGKLQRPHCDLTGIMFNKGNHPRMALIHVSDLFIFLNIICPDI